MNGIFKPKEKSIQRVVALEISLLRPNRSQPRREFDENALLSLSESIKENGIIQPVCVRRSGALYEIISGERRTRAAKLAGLTEVPCIIMEASDESSAVLALIENIQRRDLGFFEEAAAIEKLISVYGLTQEQAAARLGKAQSTIANKLRLLRFTDAERRLLVGANLSERQARALIRISDDEKRAKALEKVAARRLNLEQTEALVNEVISGEEKQENKARAEKFKQLFPKPPRLYMNSINKLIRQMKDAEVPCVTSSGTVDGYYEYIIRFPIAE